jgi:hypothetical protein
MSGPTPGPWHRRLKSEKTWHVGVYDASGSEVAHIAVKSALSARRRDADARLIAAAPDLLAALRRLMASLDAHSTLHAEDGDDVARMIEWAAAENEARAAIASATGDAP